LRVLLAEDNDAIRDLMQEMIGKRSHTVDAVVNGLEALKAVQTKAYDVVVMDMHMPVMDGCEATHLIRALDGPYSKIPIVALTAGLTESQRATYVAAGVDQIVAKPAHWPTLFEAIETRGQAVPGEEVQADDAPPPAVAVLNDAALNDLGSMIGEASLARLLDSFRDGLIEDGEQLEAALKAEDLKAARRTGHRLKGTCRQFGALELAEIGAAIEAAAGLDDVARRTAEITPARSRLAAALAARTRSALQDAPG
jgi:CheY-like chemotaxis protein